MALIRQSHWLVLICLALCISSGCRDKQGGQTESRDNYADVTAEDAAMNSAIAEARRRVREFIEAFHNPKPTYHEFDVKKPYKTPDGSHEHIWIGNVEEKDGKFYGTIANEAFETKEVFLGQRVSFELSEISDWKYLDGDKLLGGFTIRYFYERMSEKEKREFRQESGMDIE